MFYRKGKKMKDYKLIALDMDGTLLNSRKEISEKTKEMIRRAAAEGKHVVLSTGRGVAELTEYLEQLPEVRYLDCTSGAMVYDCKEQKILANDPICDPDMRKILSLAKERDVMIHFLTTKSLVEQSKFEVIDKYNMGIYHELFRKAADKCEDICRTYEEKGELISKCNLYHRSSEDRAAMKETIESMRLSVSAVYSEIASLELTAAGVNKGTGLVKLCEHLGISVDETIAVGDADNDIAILKTAGLAVAMGNAEEYVKALADVVVADCDHDGCAEAIEKYLLGNVHLF